MLGGAATVALMPVLPAVKPGSVGGVDVLTNRLYQQRLAMDAISETCIRQFMARETALPYLKSLYPQ